MPLGSIKQNASPFLIYFVIGCVLIITFLLWTMNKAEARAESYYPDIVYEDFKN